MTRTIISIASIGLLLVAGVLLGGAVRFLRGEPIVQPIQFNHLVHTEDAELECVDCHQYAMSEEFSGRPSTELCALCHAEAISESPEEALLVEYINSGEEVPWERIYQVPEHVFYSHRRHVSVAEIECAECHGDIGVSTTPPQRPLVKLKMKKCLICHEERNVTTDCNACHR